MGLINRISGGLKTAEVPLHVTGRRSWKTRFNYNKSFMEIPWNKLKNGNENELNVFNIVYRFILSRASYSTKGYKFYVMIQYCSTLVSSWLINNPIRPVFVYLYVSFFSFFFVGFFLAQTADCDVSCLRHKRMSNVINALCYLLSRVHLWRFFFLIICTDTGFVNCDLTYLPRRPTGLGFRRAVHVDQPS